MLCFIAGAPLLLLGEQKSLESLREKILHRRVSITFTDQANAAATIEEIKPASLSLRVAKTSDAQTHPRGRAEVAISSLSKLIYVERENLTGRLARTAIASALSLGILAKCTWRSQSYAVAVEGATSSRVPLVVTAFEVPGCEP